MNGLTGRAGRLISPVPCLGKLHLTIQEERGTQD